ncbi:MAG: hypothetical protein QXF01_01080 [Candidatus Micrarchaeaceae archaeon]
MSRSIMSYIKDNSIDYPYPVKAMHPHYRYGVDKYFDKEYTIRSPSTGEICLIATIMGNMDFYRRLLCYSVEKVRWKRFR